ncbi:MAG: glycoside hydrolase family 3 N-terminal domain-containing protein [Saprospiraceae bacterium]
MIEGINEFVNTLLQKMTIEEKVGQMTQVTLDVVLKGNVYKPSKPFAFDEKKLVDVLLSKHVGSILNVPSSEALTRQQWHYVVSTIQEKAMNKSRLGIPVLYGIDSIHGASYTQGATFFPHQIGLAATWNPAIAKEQGAITAYETRASSIPWVFAPVQDIARIPSWPRIYETFGEDPYLSAEMGSAIVSGFEGNDISSFDKVASCLKHFLGYGMPLSGKDRTPAWIPEHYLREYFVPSFQAAIDAGAKTIMINSGEINGVPVHASKKILTTLLRDELGFDGLAVTDWEDIKYLHTRHRVAATPKDAVRMAIDAGVDMSMVPDDLSFCKHLIELVKEGGISEERLDISVRRILKLKYELGLFENPVLKAGANYDKFGSLEFLEKAKLAAAESITLLKNDDDVLPLAKDKKILVTGWAAASMQSLNGGWSYDWQGASSIEFAKGKTNLRQAIENEIGKSNVVFAEGCKYDEGGNLDDAIEKAATVDHIILCLGENSYTEFLGNINELDLPKAQVELAQAMIKTGKQITLVLLEGRPRIISEFVDKVGSVLLGYYPGQEGASSISDIIFGKINPSGKLPYTYPRYSNALMTYDHKHAEAVELQGSEIPFNPQFEFGHGLSYTQFEYGSLLLEKNVLTEREDLRFSFSLKNTGRRIGKEVVQIYIGDDYASITPSIKRLRAFRKIELKAGEEQQLDFVIPIKQLAFVNAQNEWILEEGTFKLFVGNMTAEFELKND